MDSIITEEMSLNRQIRIQEAAKEARVLPGRRFNSRASERELNDWLAGLNLDR